MPSSIATKVPQRWIVFVLALFCLTLTSMGAKPPLVGGPAPPFILHDLEGRPVSLADYHGKVILLTFWATWCGPCKKEMPEIQAAYGKHHAKNFVVLGINFGEKQKTVKAYVRETKLTFLNLLDEDVAVASRYGVVSLPVSFFIDPDGIIRERVFGGVLTEKMISEAVNRLTLS